MKKYNKIKYNKIKLIFGLGNPGERFINTPHNFGQDLLKKIIQENLIFQNDYFQIAFYKNLYLSISKKYMNESGMVLKMITQQLKIKSSNEVLIIHDEADLPFLWLKLTFNKRPSMHKGVESIYRNYSQKIWRLRIGIQEEKRKKAKDIILKKITGERLKSWQKAKNKIEPLIDFFSQKEIQKVSIPKLFFL
ncbi:MAG: aminoacyl-tRNA hydrolase [Patescibacteria group bacterium]|nr:aminoacyl-tRNA hydrolase [Patescibacteria group bacterium]